MQQVDNDGDNCAPFDAAMVLWGAGDDEVAKVVTAFQGSWLALTRADSSSPVVAPAIARFAARATGGQFQLGYAE
jgi:hypothetical protein